MEVNNYFSNLINQIILNGKKSEFLMIENNDEIITNEITSITCKYDIDISIVE